VALLDLCRAWLALWTELSLALAPKRLRAARPWRLKIGRRDRPVRMDEADLNRLLQRHRDLKDLQKIASLAFRFRVPESNFFADPLRVERLIRGFLERNPPWLHLSLVLECPGAGEGAGASEILWREQDVHERQQLTLLVPDESWRDRPLASRTLRPARTMSEVWQGRLLDQILPPEVLVDRRIRGEILVPLRQDSAQRLEFRAEERQIEIVTRRAVPVTIEAAGPSGSGAQLLYFLLDYSASMRGHSAVLAAAVIAATLRANMGLRNTRYLFRRYADDMWPLVVEHPVQAVSLAEKDALLDTILSTNFDGGATHVNDALGVAIADIERLRREQSPEASILLVTDGRAEIRESTALKVRASGVKIHTVMVRPERNPSLQAISESFTALNDSPDLTDPASLPPLVSPDPR
jgi:hypothetical protein